MNFSSINIQGNIISSDILTKISQDDIRYQKSSDFGLNSNTVVRDEIGIAWSLAQAHWKAFISKRDNLREGDTGTTITRQSWMVPLMQALGYDLQIAKAEIINEKTYAISHRAVNKDGFPVHIVGVNQSLDKRADYGARLSPHALVQEYLNNNDHLYALTTNGSFLRVLRDATRLSRLSYLEFNLERMMEEELYAEFAVLFRVLHATRMPDKSDEGSDCIFEFYHQEALASGTRIRERLSEAVEKSIRLLGNGLLKHTENGLLREKANLELKADNYYFYLLRTVYRILFLLVIEERHLIYPEKRDEDMQKKRRLYYDFYSLQRLTKLVERRVYVDPRKTDLWDALLTTFRLFENEDFGKKLGIQALGSGLFAPNAIGLLGQLKLDNASILQVLRHLVMFENENRQWTRVNYADLDVEEFGSVYEGLLEYEPVVTTEHDMASFSFIKGEGRSSSGSHYTPEELVKPLIKHSLDYIIEDKLKEGKAQVGDQWLQKQAQCDALLTITVCDVACGSGHILLSAARRIGMELAILRESIDARSEVEQPSPSYLRKAIRDVIRNCIYGVDLNPLAVELCKVALWLEAHNPGEPLNFLDHHIKNGNAIVGLAHYDELQNGIATEAFKTLPGDDKDIAAIFRKQNEKERKDSAQLTTYNLSEVDNSLKGIQKEFADFVAMPEVTPEQIKQKSKAYNKLTTGSKWYRLKNLADLQVAQFFISKTTENKEKLTTDAKYRTYLNTGTQILDRGASLSIAQEKHFFHWFLEFPQVFNKGGFDCILGNPPYLGGAKISGYYGNDFLNLLKVYYPALGGQSDLIAYFLRRIFSIIKEKGFLSIISTNSISQGETRTGGIAYIQNENGQIIHAVKSMNWPGIAAVSVSLLSICKAEWNGDRYLDGKSVKYISSYLDDNEFSGEPYALINNIQKAFKGTDINGKGFLLDKSEALKLLNSKNELIINPFLNGRDINEHYSQDSERYVINFYDWDEEQAKKYLDCYTIIEERVKPERENNNREIYRKYWWRFGERRKALYETISGLKQTLVTASTSKYLNFVFKPTTIVFSNATAVIAMEEYKQFAIMQSSIFFYWLVKNTSTMGSSTLRFSPTDCFENFPFPNNDLINILTTIGEKYYTKRKEIQVSNLIGFTDLYNEFNSNLTEKTDIVELRQLHKQMDEAVLDAYGWRKDTEKWGKAIDMRHDFYEVDYLPENDRVRYTIHPDARKEVLKRLLLLNHERYEEEIMQGLHKKKDVHAFYEQKGKPVPEGIDFADGKKKKAAPKKNVSKKKVAEILQPSLFTPEKETTMREFGLQEGIYSIHDVSEIIGQKYYTVRRWFAKLAEVQYEGLDKAAQKDIEERRINFHGLVELVVIGTLLDNNFKIKQILKARNDLGKKTKKIYPFATNNVKDKLKVAGKSIIFEFSDGIVTLDGTGQYHLEFIREFFDDIEFDSSGVAQRLIPTKGQGKIVIDPSVGGGKPSFKEHKGIQVDTIMKFYDGPDSIPELQADYGLSKEEIEAAIEYAS